MSVLEFVLEVLRKLHIGNNVHPLCRVRSELQMTDWQRNHHARSNTGGIRTPIEFVRALLRQLPLKPDEVMSIVHAADLASDEAARQCSTDWKLPAKLAHLEFRYSMLVYSHVLLSGVEDGLARVWNLPRNNMRLVRRVREEYEASGDLVGLSVRGAILQARRYNHFVGNCVAEHKLESMLKPIAGDDKVVRDLVHQSIERTRDEILELVALERDAGVSLPTDLFVHLVSHAWRHHLLSLVEDSLAVTIL